MSEDQERPPRRLYLILGVALVAALAALWLPRWWEMRLYRQAEALTGVGAPVLPGTLTDARKKIDPGKSGHDVLAALGKPSLESSASGSSSHAIWTYYYGDGTMIVNLADEYVSRISVTYGPPQIPTSRRR